MVETLAVMEPEAEPVTKTEPKVVTESPSQPVIHLEEVVEGRVIRIAERPITFEQWLDVCGPDDSCELEDGVLVEKLTIQWEHETAERWMDRMLGTYVEKKKIGVVACSRSPVQINAFRGRLPDLFFVRQDRRDIILSKATYGAPDFVAEVVSPNDRPSHLKALEADYRTLGIPEIWFIDLPRQRLRILRKTDSDYSETIIVEGPIHLEAVEGFEIRAEWLLREPRPEVFDTVVDLLKT